MQLPLQISFHGMDHSIAVETRILETARKLEQSCQNISTCHVVVDAPHCRRNKGGLYRIRIDITMAGGERVIGRSPAGRNVHKDVDAAIRDAFETAARLLQTRAMQQQHRR